VPHSWSANLAVPSIALAIAAHPDDVEFGAGATLAKWAAAGCAVHHLVLTDGSKGTWNPDADIAALIADRQDEQREAARRLSRSPTASAAETSAAETSAAETSAAETSAFRGTVTFLGQVDGELESSLAMRGEVARCIRTVKPDVVLGHDPWKRYRIHPDHRHAGLLACEGIVASRDPFFFREHDLPTHRPHTLLLWEADEPDHAEDVAGYVTTKLHALEAHTSQFETTMHAASADELGHFRTRIGDDLAALGATHGMAAAELFKRITDL
jgi:LmbE family N-acetylglucosaminyl deacetylase